MTTQEIAKRLVAYCRKADWSGAHNELYADDAVSIEPYETPDFKKETKGRAAIKQKGETFDEKTEAMHSVEVSEPLVAGNTIAFLLKMDITMKGTDRMKMEEICVYQVKNGKIASEEFFV